jgi:hypothetical protein
MYKNVTANAPMTKPSTNDAILMVITICLPFQHSAFTTYAHKFAVFISTTSVAGNIVTISHTICVCDGLVVLARQAALNASRRIGRQLAVDAHIAIAC